MPEDKTPATRVYVPALPKRPRRSKAPAEGRWSEAEDRAINDGLQRHGRAWTKILNDPDFHSSFAAGRKPVKLKDRARSLFRNGQLTSEAAVQYVKVKATQRYVVGFAPGQAAGPS